MIRTERELRTAVARLEEMRRGLEAQEENLRASGFGDHEVNQIMEASRTFYEEALDEVMLYERLKSGDFGPVLDLHRLGVQYVGLLLIFLRIAKGITQREVAAKLGVDESSVSRDERNEYHGVTIDRATKILNVLGGIPSTDLDPIKQAGAKFREVAPVAESKDVEDALAA